MEKSDFAIIIDKAISMDAEDQLMLPFSIKKERDNFMSYLQREKNIRSGVDPRAEGINIEPIEMGNRKYYIRLSKRSHVPIAGAFIMKSDGSIEKVEF